MKIFFSIIHKLVKNKWWQKCTNILLSKRGTDITTPIPVPIQSLLEAINIDVILIHDSCGLSEPIYKKKVIIKNTYVMLFKLKNNK